MSKHTDTRSGAEVLIDALKINAVERIYCIPGESYLEVLDALYDVSNEVSLISARQEGGAGFMAEAYGKLTGQVLCSCSTRGKQKDRTHTRFQCASHKGRQEVSPLSRFSRILQ